MSLYAVVLFVHVVGAVGLFATLALEWVTLQGLRTATTAEQARGWLGAQAPSRWLGMGSFAAILFAGMYLAMSTRVEGAWVTIGLVSLVVIGVLGMVVTGRRMAPIGRALAGEQGTLPAGVAPRLDDPILWASLLTRTSIALGIVWLMTVKPDLIGALIAMTAAIVLGLAASWPSWSQARLERSRLQVPR
jgi:uncharacterized membrane protein